MKEGWTYKKLGEIAEITDYVANGSFATLRENVQYQNSPSYAILVRLADYTNSFDRSKFVYVDEHAYNFLSKSKLFGGEIIMSNVGSLGKQFICPDLGMPMSLAPNSIVIKTAFNKFYYYYFDSPFFQDCLRGISTTTALPKFNKTSFKALLAPVPPLYVQQQIVDELDTIHSILDKKNEQLKELDNLAQAIFYDMFGDPVTNEKGWEVKKLGEVCDVRDGTHDSPSYLQHSEYVLITSKNIKDGTIDFNISVNYISKEDFDAINKRSRVDIGDILMPMIGTIGNPIIVKPTNQKYCVKNVALIKFGTSDIINVFVKYLIDNPSYMAFLLSLNKGGTQKFVALGTIRNLPVPLPPLSLQQSFDAKVEAIEAQKELIRQSIREVEALLAQTMDKYFG